MSEKSIKAASQPKTQEEIDEAFIQLVSCMIEDKTKIRNSVELHEQYQVYDGDVLSRTQLLNKLHVFDHFGDYILILSGAGVASIIVFRSKAPSLLKLVNDSDDKGYLDSSIKRLIKQIIGELESNKEITKETLENSENGTLMSFLGNLSQRLDRTLTAHLIANIITGSIKNYPTPLQVSFG